MTGNDMADRGSIPGTHEQHFSLHYHNQNVFISYPAGSVWQPIIQNECKGRPTRLHVKTKTMSLPGSFW
jgi:hypothetical protein